MCHVFETALGRSEEDAVRRGERRAVKEIRRISHKKKPSGKLSSSPHSDVPLFFPGAPVHANGWPANLLTFECSASSSFRSTPIRSFVEFEWTRNSDESTIQMKPQFEWTYNKHAVRNVIFRRWTVSTGHNSRGAQWISSRIHWVDNIYQISTRYYPMPSDRW